MSRCHGGTETRRTVGLASVTLCLRGPWRERMRMLLQWRLAFVVASILISTAPLAAHDMWIEPMTFSPEAGEIVGVKLRVGQDFLGDPLPRDPALINQFVVEDAEGRKPVVG